MSLNAKTLSATQYHQTAIKTHQLVGSKMKGSIKALLLAPLSLPAPKKQISSCLSLKHSALTLI